MVDALVLEASTSVCGFESHLPHQKKRAPKGAFFFWCQGIWHSQMPPAAAGSSASLHVWQEPAVPPHTPLPFCDTIQFAIETDRSCHRQRPGAEWRSGLFSLPQISAPVPADLNLPGSKKTPGRVPSFGLYHRLPQDSPSRIRAAERHTKTIHSSLFSLPSPHSGLSLPLPGSAREPLSAGAGNQFPGGNAGLQNALSPPHSPACRAQAHSEPVPQSGTPQLFTLHSSLFTLPALLLFPSGTDSKTKIYFVFWPLDT